MKRHALVPLIVMTALAVGAAKLGQHSPREDMASAAARFLESLTPELRAKAGIAFDDKARTDWHFVPRTRPGVTFGELGDAQRSAARELVRAALSPRGVLKVEEIMSLDLVLRELEKGTPTEASRNPDAYSLTVYGDPKGPQPWGWKIEGHHISLNFTLPRDTVAVTPAFLGASPAQVKQGPRAGLRVLALEEDLGRELARSLDDSQRKEAITETKVPADILTAPGRSPEGLAETGLTYAKMTDNQKSMVDRLLEEFAGNLRHELAASELDRVKKAGLDAIRFTWIGETEPGRPHYYRLAGPTFIIEYDNTQNSANHVHTVWHDRERDFGRDALKDHYEHDHK